VVEADVGAHGVGEPVHPRDAFGVGAGQPGEPQYRPLDRHRGVLTGEVDDRLAGLAREAARLPDGDRIEVELLRHHNPSA